MTEPIAKSPWLRAFPNIDNDQTYYSKRNSGILYVCTSWIKDKFGLITLPDIRLVVYDTAIHPGTVKVDLELYDYRFGYNIVERRDPEYPDSVFILTGAERDLAKLFPNGQTKLTLWIGIETEGGDN